MTKSFFLIFGMSGFLDRHWSSRPYSLKKENEQYIAKLF